MQNYNLILYNKKCVKKPLINKEIIDSENGLTTRIRYGSIT